MSKVKHRRSFRLQEYDYSHGTYFVTICTANRKSWLGSVVNGAMVLSDPGLIITEEWQKTPTLRPYVKLDQFVVMPNHFHGILIIYENRGTARHAPTKQQFGKPFSGLLPTIIRAFKSAATKRINEMQGTPGAAVCQRSFYEHVIRDEASLNRIREYILNNPKRWEFDRDNPQRQAEDKFYQWLAGFKTRPAKLNKFLS